MPNFTQPGTEHTWHGITLNANHSHVLSIDLSANNLEGIIPGVLKNMTYLEELDLGANSIGGMIPSGLGDLTNLERLNLAENDLAGSIPSELGSLSNLEYLSLVRNHLSGSIPSELGSLSNLVFFPISGNQLSGSIPTSLSNLTNLQMVWLSYNALYTEDDTLRIFIEEKNPEIVERWEDTQTIAPKNVILDDSGFDTSAGLIWDPILYTENIGGYRVLYSPTAGGPYTLFGTTADKTIDRMDVTGLDPDTTYYFVVQTRTISHSMNPNTVNSEYSEEVCGGLDTDDDGTPDCNDNCPEDPDKIEAGVCGCGIPEGSCDDEEIPAGNGNGGGSGSGSTCFISTLR